MSFRKEKKYPLTFYETQVFFKNYSNLKKIYPDRKISSIYFDNFLYRCFFESEEGLLPRKKYRIRNYPNQSNKSFFLEKKISSIEGSFKTSTAISSDLLSKKLKNGILDNSYGLIMPVMNITYSRNYFAINELRLTLDTNIKYQKFKNNYCVMDNFNVLELKSSLKINDDEFIKILNSSNKRFSKYANGIKLLNLV